MEKAKLDKKEEKRKKNKRKNLLLGLLYLVDA